MAPLSPDEAKETLAHIDAIARDMRRAVGSTLLSFNLLLWGIIWMLAFCLSFFYPPKTGLIWTVLASLGAVATFAAGFFHARRPIVDSEQSRKLGLQILWFWLTVMGFAMILGFVIQFRTHGDQLLFFVGIIMLAYVMMGIWLRSPILCIIGIVVAIAAVVGRIWLPPRAYQLWMAFFGGGGLFFPGLYVQLRWK